MPTPEPTRPPAVRRLGPAVDRFPALGEWAGYRGNGTLDAWQPLAGKITAPAIAWQHFVGAVETLLIVAPGPGDALDLPLGEPASEAAEPAELRDPRWGLVSRAG